MVKRVKKHLYRFCLFVEFFLTSQVMFSQTPDLLSATLVGAVTNAVTGLPVTGAHITVNGVTTHSVSAGVFSMNIDPAGTYPVSCAKAGFDSFTTPPVSFSPGAIVSQNFQLWETPNPSPALRAVMDTANQRIYLSWDKPGGLYELLYDDGIQDNFTIWATAGNMNAVKFTPKGYPVLVTGCSINLGKASNYPPGSSPLVPFQVIVLDAGGAGGTPGNVLAGPMDVIPASLGWIDFTFPYPVTLNGGNFFIAMIQGGNAPNAAGIAIDETMPQYRSFNRFMNGNGPWLPASGNFLMRALVSGPGGPPDLPDNEKGLLAYQIWRLHQGEEMNPQAWTFLGTVSLNETVDPSWPAFPCGAHRWAVQAKYTGNRLSSATFSNVLGKCWTAPVTVNLSLSCDAANPAGTLITLKNLVYQDTVYHAFLTNSGQTTFPRVWKGSYEIKAEKFGYLDYIGNCSVNGPLNLDAFLLQIKSPPTNIKVDSMSLRAVWDVPFYTVPLLQEDWSSGNFISGGWVLDGGTNWRISMTAGHPAPAAFFSWAPPVPNYEQSLTSRIISGKNSSILSLKYDISLDNYSTSVLDQMAIEIFDGNTWHTLKTWNNAGGNIPWTTDLLDISAYTSTNFKIRFRSFGVDSYQINGWYIDNILIKASESAHLLAPCIHGYNFYLDNTLLSTVTENNLTIPGKSVKYDSAYRACVLAVYSSGYSDNNCTNFKSRFLWPPSNLHSELIENNVFLSWNKPRIPSDTGVLIPPGIMGYNIYRNGNLFTSLTGSDVLSYYDIGLEPGNYSYAIDAVYDLTPYGFPGQEAASMMAGPVSVLVHYGRLLPFTEPWTQGSFSYNDWRFIPAPGNWSVSQETGKPVPSACFSGLPELFNYSFALESPALDATPFDCARIWLDFDLKLVDKNASGKEKMILEVYYNNSWHKKIEIINSGSIDWTSHHIDISVVKGKGFRFRFRASGDHSTDITSWFVDNISAYAICLPATNPSGEAWGNDIHLAWSPPQCNGGGILVQEGFEEAGFPPPGWTRITYNISATWSHTGIGPPIGVHTGNFSAGLSWDYNHQDEWIIARNVFVNGNLKFWSLAYQGSAHGDHYYVKVSTDQGGSWEILMDLSTLPPFPGPGGYNHWQQPYLIDMSPWMGDVVDIAWHALDQNAQGLWYYWGIDDVSLGDKKIVMNPDPCLYDVFRQNNPGGDYLRANNAPLTDTTYTDPMLPAGLYHYYIKVVNEDCSETLTSDTISVDVVTSVGTLEDQSVKIFPNPAKDWISIKSDTPLTRLTLTDILGKVVLDEQIKQESETRLDISGFKPGLYILKTFSKKSCQTSLLSIHQ